VNLEIVLLDDRVRPHDVEELGLRHQAVAALDQCEQHVEGARLEDGFLAVDQQAPLARPDLELIELHTIVRAARATAAGLRRQVLPGHIERAQWREVVGQ
jgi:hypothetical protein